MKFRDYMCLMYNVLYDLVTDPLVPIQELFELQMEDPLRFERLYDEDLFEFCRLSDAPQRLKRVNFRKPNHRSYVINDGADYERPFMEVCLVQVPDKTPESQGMFRAYFFSCRCLAFVIPKDSSWKPEESYWSVPAANGDTIYWLNNYDATFLIDDYDWPTEGYALMAPQPGHFWKGSMYKRVRFVDDCARGHHRLTDLPDWRMLDMYERDGFLPNPNEFRRLTRRARRVDLWFTS